MRCACSCDLPPLFVAFDRFVDVSGVRLGSWGLGRMSRRGAGFRQISCRIIVIICGRAVVYCRCRSLCSLFCDCSCAVPAPAISLHSLLRSIGSCGCVVCSLGFVGLLGGSEGAGALGCAQTRFSRAEEACGVFSRLVWSPASPSRSLLYAGRFLESTTTHVHHKPSSSCAVYLYVPVSMMRTTGKFAAGVTTKHTRNGPAPNKKKAT